MASNKSKTPGPIQVVVVLMLTVLAFYFGNRFGQVFDFNTIIDCCDTTLFLGGKSNSTNKEISEMIGKQTINQKTFGETRGQSGSSSKNIQIQGRDLIDAAEIGKMNRREAILLIAGTNPLKDLKYPVEQHPNYIYLDPGRNKPGQVKNRCLYDEPFDILEYMDEIRTKDATYAS